MRTARSCAPFLYRCPNTGQKVQTWAADDPEDDDLSYVQYVPCVRTGASGEPEDRQGAGL